MSCEVLIRNRQCMRVHKESFTIYPLPPPPPILVGPFGVERVAGSSSTYDTELEALHDTVQQRVVTLLSDSDNIVKQTLLETGITRLAVFFGRQKGRQNMWNFSST